MGQPALDPEEFLRRLKAEHQVLRWEPLPPQNPQPFSGSGQVRSRDSLDYLHANWALPDSYDPAMVGGGGRGKLIGLFGRLTYRVLGPYLRKERDLLAHLVRVNEALERRCDDLAARVQQLNEDILRRQTDEARNQAKLALWLHLDPPSQPPRRPRATAAQARARRLPHDEPIAHIRPGHRTGWHRHTERNSIHPVWPRCWRPIGRQSLRRAGSLGKWQVPWPVEPMSI